MRCSDKNSRLDFYADGFIFDQKAYSALIKSGVPKEAIFFTSLWEDRANGGGGRLIAEAISQMYIESASYFYFVLPDYSLRFHFERINCDKANDCANVTSDRNITRNDVISNAFYFWINDMKYKKMKCSVEKI